METNDYRVIARSVDLVFGPPRDEDIRWAYRLAKFKNDRYSFASISAVPVTPHCKIFVPLLPYDYASPSDCCYLVHFLSSVAEGENLKRCLCRLLQQVLATDDFRFPLTVVTWIETRAGSRLWKAFYGIDIEPRNWLRVKFSNPENIFAGLRKKLRNGH